MNAGRMTVMVLVVGRSGDGLITGRNGDAEQGEG